MCHFCCLKLRKNFYVYVNCGASNARYKSKRQVMCEWTIKIKIINTCQFKRLLWKKIKNIIPIKDIIELLEVFFSIFPKFLYFQLKLK